MIVERKIHLDGSVDLRTELILVTGLEPWEKGTPREVLELFAEAALDVLESAHEMELVEWSDGVV